MNNPLVSVIVTTKNSAESLKACLQSVKEQSYNCIELIVVDNHSIDSTLDIAKVFTKHVYTIGPERSAQRNYGVLKSNGEYLLFIDSDMALSEDVVMDCVGEVKKKENIAGVIIPEESFGTSFWAKCKKLERSFYRGVDWIEAARFFKKKVFEDLGGFTDTMISGEDWDLSQRVKEKYSLARINSVIYHNEGDLLLFTTVKKKYYYARNIAPYLEKHSGSKESKKQTDVLGRYALYFRDYRKLVKHPIIGVGMLFMKTCEFTAGFVGILLSSKTKI